MPVDKDILDILEGTDNEYDKIVKEVPEVEKYNYGSKLRDALNSARMNISYDNPFLKVKGNYTFHLDTSKSGSEKTEYIHKKVTDYLFENTGRLFVFRPGDNSKIYPLDDEQHSFKVSRLLKDAPNEIQKLLTQYPTVKKQKIDIRISTDPLDIIKKSTHQAWESCEIVGGAYCQGIFSDIENNNAIAYIYIDDSPKPSGRFMLRWCNTPEKKADIGIEPIMYPHKSYSMEIYELIRGIIGSKGYGTYDDCVTPYIYTGYSDMMGNVGGPTIITYHSGPGETVLIQYASLPDISRNLALALAEHGVYASIRRALAENDAVCNIEDAVNKLSKDIDTETKINLIQTCMRDTYRDDQLVSRKTLSDTAINNLINDNEEVRIELAHNINNVPESVLEKLADDKEYIVRAALARNKFINCCDNIINKLAKDKSIAVRQELLSTAKMLQEEAVMSLATMTKKDIGLSEESVMSSVEDMQSTLASREYIGKYPEAVRILADKEYKYTRKELALNEAITCCDDVIEKLTNDRPEIAIKLLYNKTINKPIRKKTIENILNKLKEYTGLAYAYEIEIDTNLAEQPEICDYSDIIDRAIKTGIGSSPASALAENIHISCRPDIIRKLSNAPLDIRKKLSQNPAIVSTPDIAEKMFNDSNNPYIQENILNNPAIMEINSIKDKLIKHIDHFKELGTLDNYEWKKMHDTTYVYKQGFLNLKTSDVLYNLAKNIDLYKDKQLFDKVYEQHPDDILSKNPHIFERKDIISKVFDSNDVLKLQSLITNPTVTKYPEIMQKVLDIPNRDIHSSLYETISFVNQKARGEGQKEKDIPDYIKDIHKKLYYKLYPEQYAYENMHR